MWGSGYFVISSLDSVLSSNENGAHNLLGPLLLVCLSWRTIRAVLHQSIESVLYTSYILQINISEAYGFLCEFTNAQVLQQAIALFEDLP